MGSSVLKQLTNSEVNDILCLHIPYRALVISAPFHDTIDEEKQPMTHWCQREASLMMIRALLEAMGMKKLFKSSDNAKKDDFRISQLPACDCPDSKVDDNSTVILRANGAQLARLNSTDYKCLEQVYLGAEKSCFHFTTTKIYEHNDQTLKTAVNATESLLQQLVYDKYPPDTLEIKKRNHPKGY